MLGMSTHWCFGSVWFHHGFVGVKIVLCCGRVALMGIALCLSIHGQCHASEYSGKFQSDLFGFGKGKIMKLGYT